MPVPQDNGLGTKRLLVKVAEAVLFLPEGWWLRDSEDGGRCIACREWSPGGSHGPRCPVKHLEGFREEYGQD